MGRFDGLPLPLERSGRRHAASSRGSWCCQRLPLSSLRTPTLALISQAFQDAKIWYLGTSMWKNSPRQAHLAQTHACLTLCWQIGKPLSQDPCLNVCHIAMWQTFRQGAGFKCVGGVGWVVLTNIPATVTNQRHSGHVSGSASYPVYKYTNTQITNLKYTHSW